MDSDINSVSVSVSDRLVQIFQWNCHGIRQRVEELKQHLSQSTANSDILCLQETFLKEKQKISFPGYKIVRHDRPDRGGGGLITLIRDTLNYSEIAGPDDIECIIVKVKLSTSYLTVVNLYLPPRQKVDKIMLKELFGPKTAIVGDLNAKSKIWGSPHSDSRGLIIEELLDECNFFL